MVLARGIKPLVGGGMFVREAGVPETILNAAFMA